jgi:hypothetical protein
MAVNKHIYIKLEDPDPGLNSDPELPGSVNIVMNPEPLLENVVQLDPGEGWKFSDDKDDIYITARSRRKGEGARETHGAKAHAADVTNRQKEK